MKNLSIFEELFKKHYIKLYTFAFRLTGKKEIAEDVLQNSFLNAIKYYENYRNESSHLTWLYRIVINESKKYMKKVSKLPVDVYAENNNKTIDQVYSYINSFGNSENALLVKEARETCLQLFMNCMPSKYRIVFTLRIILDLTTDETSNILNISHSSVKVNLHRSRNLIKSYITGKCSLINKKNPCKCSAWVKYSIDNNLNILKSDIKTIQKIENEYVKQFKSEVSELYKIYKLYNNFISPDSFENFKNHLRKIIIDNNMQILGKTQK